jgi:hypothetical protein
MSELADKKFQAILLSNCMIYASPSYDEKGVRAKQQMFDKFLSSLTPKTNKKKKPDHNSLLRFFSRLGVKVNKKDG